MVRVAGLTDQAASGLAVRSPDGRTPQEALTEIRERVLELYARAVAALARRARARRSQREGIPLGRVEDCRDEELDELERPLRARGLPGADAARGRARPAVPVHLRRSRSASASSSRDPETDEERFARVKVPEGLPRFLARRRRAASCSRSRT